MGKIPIDYNKLRELGMKALKEDCPKSLSVPYRKGNLYI
jgi:hypothetical protein